MKNKRKVVTCAKCGTPAYPPLIVKRTGKGGKAYSYYRYPHYVGPGMKVKCPVCGARFRGKARWKYHYVPIERQFYYVRRYREMDAGVISAIAFFCGIGVLLAIAAAYLMRTRKAMLTGIEQAAVWGSIAGYFVWFLLFFTVGSTPSLWSTGTLFFLFFLSALCILPTVYLHYRYSQHLNSAIMMVIGGAIAGAIGYPILIARHFWNIYKLKPAPKLAHPKGQKKRRVSKEDLEKET